MVTTAGPVRLVGALLGVGFLAAGVTVALSSLPNPAAGGTCGPSQTSSESALAAFVNPGSIGAGPEPPAASGERPQWLAFVDQCQTATDTRMAQAAATLAAGLLLGLGPPWLLRRRRRKAGPADQSGGPAAGWYPDPAGSGGTRWWDGQAWGAAHPATAPPG